MGEEPYVRCSGEAFVDEELAVDHSSFVISLPPNSNTYFKRMKAERKEKKKRKKINRNNEILVSCKKEMICWWYMREGAGEREGETHTLVDWPSCNTAVERQD